MVNLTPELVNHPSPNPSLRTNKAASFYLRVSFSIHASFYP